MVSVQCVSWQTGLQLQKLVLGTWNIISLVGKLPELVCEAESWTWAGLFQSVWLDRWHTQTCLCVCIQCHINTSKNRHK